MNESNNSSKTWRLVADIGGTNARFGLVDPAGEGVSEVVHFSVAEHASFEGAVSAYLELIAAKGAWEPLPSAACLAVACPVDVERIVFTNSPWVLDRTALGAQLDGVEPQLINDFAAVGYAVTQLDSDDWRQVGGSEVVEGCPIAVLGPGTGLGVGSVVPGAAGLTVVAGEGGHVDFAPVNEREIRVLEVLKRSFERVSVERLLCGAGLLNIYRALAELEGRPVPYQEPAEITAAALQGEDSLAVDTLDIFCEVLGATAGNLALILGARGGVYVAGGIVPRILDYFENSGFRDRFEAKGRMGGLLREIPVRVVTRDNLGLLGAASCLALQAGNDGV